MRPLERLVRSLPPSLNGAVKDVRHALDPLVVAAWRRRTGDRDPLPPSRSRARAGGGTNPTSWRRSGTEQAAQMLDAARVHGGLEPARVRSVLDWGCGAGRVLVPLASRLQAAGSTAVLHGCDVDDESIAWASRELPGIDWSVNRYEPPLPYAEASIELLYSISIVTHLDEEDQRAWLAEVRRIVQPGGIALITVQGPHAFRECAAGRVVSKSAGCARRIATHASLEDEGFIYEPYDRPAAHQRDFIGVARSYGMAFHSPEHVRRTWSEWFEVLAVLDRGAGGWQDIVVLRRP